MPNELKERDLPDDYPVHEFYLYVIDDRVWRAPYPATVGEIKKLMPEVKSIKNCDIAGRDIWHLAI